jgi:hypothetical protein
MIDDAVKDAVLAWANAANVQDAAARLAEARKTLAQDLFPALCDEIAEITTETLLGLLARKDRIGAHEKTTDVFGVALFPAQLERFSAWVNDQRTTADALGLPFPTWMGVLERGAARVLERAADEEANGPPEQDVGAASSVAKKLIGAEKAAFENRPKTGTSAAAGIMGLIAAYKFDKT